MFQPLRHAVLAQRVHGVPCAPKPATSTSEGGRLRSGQTLSFGTSVDRNGPHGQPARMHSLTGVTRGAAAYPARQSARSSSKASPSGEPPWALAWPRQSGVTRSTVETPPRRTACHNFTRVGRRWRLCLVLPSVSGSTAARNPVDSTAVRLYDRRRRTRMRVRTASQVRLTAG